MPGTCRLSRLTSSAIIIIIIIILIIIIIMLSKHCYRAVVIDFLIREFHSDTA
jgi:hypothetical protein